MAALTPEFIERASVFGPEKSLLGVVAFPAISPGMDEIAFVILNTGATHRVGHNRMYVSLARNLARAGHAALRYDQSGLGDSAPSVAGLPILESNLADLRTAIDWLEATTHATRFVLVGLCSGADHSVLYGYKDPRVVGLILLDPYIPTTMKYFFTYIYTRISEIGFWRGFSFKDSTLLRRMAEHLPLRRGRGSELGHISFQGENPRATLSRIYAATVRAGLQILVICTGASRTRRQTYREQFIDAFPSVAFGGLLRLEYFEDCDHTFASTQHRELLNDLVLEWVAGTQFRRLADPTATNSDAPQYESEVV